MRNHFTCGNRKKKSNWGRKEKLYKNFIRNKSCTIQKLQRSQHQNMNHGRGPTAQAMAIMKNEAKNNYELTHLIQDLYKLRRATPKR